MAMTTQTAMAYRMAAPPDKAEERVAEVLAEACPRAVVASTRRGEHP